MKKNIVIIFLLIPFFSDAQNTKEIEISDCTSDSLVYDVFLLELDSIGIQYSYVDPAFPGKVKLKKFSFNSDIKRRMEQNNYCSFLLYILGFDRLLRKGLDLSFDHSSPKNIPIYQTSTIIVGDTSPKVMDPRFEQRRLYRNFLSLKEGYEKYIITPYLTENGKESFYSLVDDIIMSGHYRHPQILKKILRSEFAHFTEEKFIQDMREANKE